MRSRSARTATRRTRSPAFDDFTGVYAPTTRTPQPWFRRRGAKPAVPPLSEPQQQKVATAAQTLRTIAAEHIPAAFASSFGAEDMVVIDLIARHALPIRIFTLDTGRLPDETHALIDRTRKRYGLPIDVYAPDTRRVQAFVRSHGVNAFYDSVELRKECCAIRKTEPLARALVAKGAWITGLRREQSVTRAVLPLEEFDRVHGIPKFNPLAEWSNDDVWAYVRGPRRPVQRAARPRLSLHRLRPVHARRPSGRGPPRRTLVVGGLRAQGMRIASACHRAADRRPARGQRSRDAMIAEAPDSLARARARQSLP